MGSDFITKIGEIAEVFDGPHATPKKIDTGPYFLSISSLENGQLDLSKSAHLSEEQFVKWTKRVTPREGDVLFSYETRLGEAALMPGGVKACLGRRMGLLRPNLNKVLPEYLLYAYLSPAFQSEIKKRTNHGATVERISLKELPDFEVRIPALSEQKSTVKILKALNEKIALNNQINQTLEQMAQTLFKSWFVDYDPVIDNALDAISSGKKVDIPEVFESRVERRKAVRESADFKPLPDDVRQLFPSEFEESELGWVPKGWRGGNISDLALINPSSWTKKNAPDQVEYVDLASAKFGTIQSSDIYAYDEAPSRARRILFKHDTIFGMVRPANRSFAYVDRNGLTGSTGFVVVRAKESAARSFIHIAITSNDAISEFVRIADGAAYPAIKPDDIADYPTVLPCPEVLKLFEGIVSNYREKIATNISSAKDLAELRDILLPKLISGELCLDSPEVEQAKALVD
ncbi:TPA: restriction endonuclease subunit S [Vibrio campbellii]|nr:restriction endonuclease subunit S [Vibrio campbellii]HDM8241635.1 restriction endonuclease subunit S [Vibrio campbellii]